MTLDATQVTQAAPLADGASAASCLAVILADARPAIAVRQDLGTGGDPVWTVVDDLLGSEAEDQHLVLEVEADGEVTLRSGDRTAGALPGPEPMTVRLRSGTGAPAMSGRGHRAPAQRRLYRA